LTRVYINKERLQRAIVEPRASMQALYETATAFKEAGEQASPYGTSVHWGKFVGIHGYFKRRWRVRKYPTFYRVGNVDRFSHLVEFGSSRNPAYSPFRRTLRAFGGKENPKKSAEL
jgi:hypothetical protein